MQSDLPRPEQILEELADKTAIGIERLAPVAFDNALKELIAYHRFLLEVSAPFASDKPAISYAEITGDTWLAPHRQWIRQYRRLFERAANCMPEDDHFISSLAYTPIRLMPGRDEVELPLDVAGAILNLGPMTMHGLETWITKRTVVENLDNEAVNARLALSGSDAKAYENVLPEIMGAWEKLLNHISSTCVFPDTGEQSEKERWNTYQASWPLLWYHLTNTAYCLSLTVWNEDEAGARMFSEALVRWPQQFDYQVFGESDLQHQWLLYPTIFDWDWVEARERASLLAYAYEAAPTPKQVLANAIRNMHQDVVLLTAALLLSWTINKKQTSDIGARYARSLFVRNLYRPEDRRDTSLDFSFGALFLNLIRVKVAGDAYQDDSYAAYLNGLIWRLDNMTERRVVPGRSYTPSTLDDWDGLVVPLVAMLTSVSSKDSANAVDDHVSMFTGAEKILPDGDRSLRNVLHEFGRWDSVLKRNTRQLRHAIELLLSDDGRVTTAPKELREIVQSAHSRIERVRLKRLRARPVDTQKLEEIRAGIQSVLFDETLGEPIFQGVESGVDSAGDLTELREIASVNVRKAKLVDPPMEPPSANLLRSLVVSAKHTTDTLVWRAFCDRPHESWPVRARVEMQGFWDEISALIEEAGPDPVLAVAQRAEGRRLRRIFMESPSDWPELVFERPPPGARSAFYVGTMGRVRVYGVELPPGSALLFSATSLRSVYFSEMGQTERYVDVSYEPAGEIVGTLRIHVRLGCTWTETPTFRFVWPDLGKA